jgi:hypothetical protein
MGGNSTGRRRVRERAQAPVGNWQVRYPGADGLLRSDERTYESKSEAERRLSRSTTERMKRPSK